MEFTPEERATILAALSLYVSEGCGDPANRSDEVHELATRGDDLVSLDEHAVVALATRIKAAGEYVQVEWDPFHYGGDYDAVGDFAYLPASEVTDENIKEVFERVTGRNPIHIVSYDLDELYDENGDPLD